MMSNGEGKNKSTPDNLMEEQQSSIGQKIKKSKISIRYWIALAAVFYSSIGLAIYFYLSKENKQKEIKPVVMAETETSNTKTIKTTIEKQNNEDLIKEEKTKPINNTEFITLETIERDLVYKQYNEAGKNLIILVNQGNNEAVRLLAELIYFWAKGEDIEGTGGNIYMKLEGGTIRNVYGGNQLYGDIEGDIIIEINSCIDDCLLSIDTVYGGNQMAIYHPDLVNGEPRVSPQVYVKHGTVNYDVFGGGYGDARHLYEYAGQVTSHPYVVIGGDQSDDKPVVGRDVFGGGSMADVIGDTKVVLRGNALVGGSVYGGAKEGTVQGSTDVQIAPENSDTPEIPTPQPPEYYRFTFNAYPPVGGTVEVTDTHGNRVENGSLVASGSILHIVARSNTGYTFHEWHADHGVVVQPTEYNTSFVMGPFDCTLTAEFAR